VPYHRGSLGTSSERQVLGKRMLDVAEKLGSEAEEQGLNPKVLCRVVGVLSALHHLDQV
jgi:hypothetical protein